MALSMAMSLSFHLIFTFESALTFVAFLSERDSTLLAAVSGGSSVEELCFTRLDRGSFKLLGSALLLGSPALRRGSFAAFLGSTRLFCGLASLSMAASLGGDLLPV